jgi:hypothetical protein
MARGLTLAESRWPDTPEFRDVAVAWRKDAITILLSHVWKGYDSFRNEILSVVNMSKVSEERERSITQLLWTRIDREMTKDEPFFVAHEAFEWETRKRPPAQSPKYDIAFVLYANERIMWPLEAKVLPTDRSVATYVRDVNNEFLRCRYAPFSAGGAMIGYLISGDADTAFDNIARSLKCILTHHPDFMTRKHKYSDHRRSGPRCKRSPSEFRCQHLIMEMF